MSKADEMLNNLNYKFIKEDDYFIIYEKDDFAVYKYILTFNKKAKSVIKHHKVYDDRLFVTMQELQAINEKVKELRLDRRRR